MSGRSPPQKRPRLDDSNSNDSNNDYGNNNDDNKDYDGNNIDNNTVSSNNNNNLIINNNNHDDNSSEDDNSSVGDRTSSESLLSPARSPTDTVLMLSSHPRLPSPIPPTSQSPRRISAQSAQQYLHSYPPPPPSHSPHHAHYPPPHHDQSRRPHIEPSIFNSSALSDTLDQVATLIFNHLDQPNIEIEGKLGRIIDKSTRQRLQLPVMCETILTPRAPWPDVRFESAMTEEQHRHFNSLLNNLIKERSKSHPPSMIHRHTRETDIFYAVKNGGPKIRVTRDQKTGEIIGIIQKRKLADLDIYNPRSPLDFRITISSETPVPMPMGLEPSLRREKDRISYKHALFKVDLTQVKTPSMANNTPFYHGVPAPTSSVTVTHELEVEFVKPENSIVKEREKQMQNQPNVYLDMVNSFLNTVRLLARRSVPFRE